VEEAVENRCTGAGQENRKNQAELDWELARLKIKAMPDDSPAIATHPNAV